MKRNLELVAAVLLYLSAAGPAAAQFLKEGQPELKAEAAAPTASGGYPQFTALVKEVGPAVVNISVEADNEEEQLDPANPFLKRDPSLPFRSLGSGCIVNKEGYIITNNHVVEKAERIIVRLLDDKTEYTAKLIGRDSKTDLALIKIEPKGDLKTVYFGDSDDLTVGEWVLAIGNQFQLGQTVTAGIVSAKSRRVPNKTSGPYDAYIQTDASINPGSSGGPLFNTRGQLVGINTAIFSPGRAQFGGTGFNIGIGFSIPSNLVKSVVTQVKEHGKVTRGLLGVIIQRVDSDMADALGLKRPDGALVADIMPDSPALKAGFQRKDVILSFDGHPIKDHEDLPLLVANTPIGTTAKIEVLRNGETEVLTAKIDELKESSPKKEDPQKSNDIGLILQNVTADIAKSLNMPAPAGVIVSGVQPNSSAERAGVLRGDVIEEFNGELVKDIEHFESIVKKLPKEKPVLMLVRRAEGTRFLTLKVKSLPKS